MPTNAPPPSPSGRPTVVTPLEPAPTAPPLDLDWMGKMTAARPVVAGHYEVDLDEPLGVGGMAIVYRGRDLRTRREVALKTVRPEFRGDEGRRARFRREARTMAFLSHPNVVRVYDLYDGDDDGPWAVLELIQGPSLKEILRRDGPLDPQRAGRILKQVAEALDHLHRRGLVHLDVKPQNLILTVDDHVKLIDFGIAQPSGLPQETLDGQTFATAAYLAPEQALGDIVDIHSDVYALGCVVFEMLTGRPPFGPDDAPAATIIQAHLRVDPPLFREVRPEIGALDHVEDAVMRALAKEPGERFADCTGFAAAFRRALDLDQPQDPADQTRELPVFHRAQRTVWDRPDLADHAYAPAPRPGGRPLVSRVRTRFVWRLVGILAVANLMLAGLSLWQTGTVPGVYAASDQISPGAGVVAVDEVNLRSGPSLDAGIVAVVEDGAAMIVTGGATTRDGQVWWPVAYDLDGFTVRAYASASYLSAVRSTGRDRVLEWLDSLTPR